MRKHDKRQQNLFNDEEHIHEHTRIVRAPRQEHQKQKGTNGRKGNIPRM